MKLLFSFAFCAFGVAAAQQTAVIPMAQLCKPPQIGSYTVTTTISTFAIITFTCITPPTSSSTPPTGVPLLILVPSTLSPAADGVNTVFTLSANTPFTILTVYQNGLLLMMTNDYTVSTNNGITSITFTKAPPANAVFQVFYYAFQFFPSASSLIQCVEGLCTFHSNIMAD